MNKSEKYCASARLGARLGTSPRARLDRIKRAIGAKPTRIELTGQASATTAFFPGVTVLVSYEAAVAYRLTDGSEVATPRNYFSKTTDRSMSDWLHQHDVVRLEPDVFMDRLRARLAT